MTKLKSEAYKGIHIKFRKIPGCVIADAGEDGMGMEEAKTKTEAFSKMKSTIDKVLKIEKRNKSKVRGRYPSGTEKIMASE